MYIHLGEKKIISDRTFVGIFNAETIRMSSLNLWIKDSIEDNDRSVAINANNDIIGSGVSPFTVIKRVSYRKDLIWSKN
jgi:regulator of extracellular matrix RemA (YlzA/DUF370 family)